MTLTIQWKMIMKKIEIFGLKVLNGKQKKCIVRKT